MRTQTVVQNCLNKEVDFEKEKKEAAFVLKHNSYHDFADGEAEAMVEAIYRKGFRIMKSRRRK